LPAVTLEAANVWPWVSDMLSTTGDDAKTLLAARVWPCPKLAAPKLGEPLIIASAKKPSFCAKLGLSITIAPEAMPKGVKVWPCPNNGVPSNGVPAVIAVGVPKLMLGVSAGLSNTLTPPVIPLGTKACACVSAGEPRTGAPAMQSLASKVSSSAMLVVGIETAPVVSALGVRECFWEKVALATDGLPATIFEATNS